MSIQQRESIAPLSLTPKKLEDKRLWMWCMSPDQLDGRQREPGALFTTPMTSGRNSDKRWTEWFTMRTRHEGNAIHAAHPVNCAQEKLSEQVLTLQLNGISAACHLKHSLPIYLKSALLFTKIYKKKLKRFNVFFSNKDFLYGFPLQLSNVVNWLTTKLLSETWRKCARTCEKITHSSKERTGQLFTPSI